MSETLYNLLNQNWFWQVLSIIAFVPAIVCHEVSHGFAAYKLGDNTAKNAGRLTLNPIKHIDLFGTIILPLLLAVCNLPVFGYAKPVPFNPNNLKDKKTGEVIIAIAGPAANLILGILGGIIALILRDSITSDLTLILFYFFYYFSVINFVLLFFNIIPIPPLDGASVLVLFVPKKHMNTYYTIQQYAMPILLIVLVVFPYVFNIDLLSGYFDATAYALVDLICPLS